MRVLILGAGGQLGRELARAPWPTDHIGIARTRTETDITSVASIARALDDTQADIVVNAAAYTAVDRAEHEPEYANAINAEGAEYIAQACHARRIPLIHISTDYVFDGSKPAPYLETDPINPLGVYGRTKADGEAAICRTHQEHIILRTAWVYSVFGQNFVKTMLRMAAAKPELRVVNDQIGCPTSARELALAIMRLTPELVKPDAPFGTYHLTCSGEASWYDLAEAIFEDLEWRTGTRPKLAPIPSREYPTPACRPANSRLDNDKFASVFGFCLPEWRKALLATLDEIHGKEMGGENHERHHSGRWFRHAPASPDQKCQQAASSRL